ncbi:hypothetical protein K435DRAFT_724952 [Dendrothele bispora CBS 962.96]|uniref:Phenol 2-monooxygenase n=1 Tax=Dendrothele bispora (strain CBS 962.96) TaxID=1314807 RepID=A0A4S8LW33_DENBC|nr:hypothetical protein K435DRAFT_724952 [Dendrothele bispora CBS 962.96]
MKESQVDVLVIGAGPAGLMCTFGLARAGVKVRVVDERPDKVAAGQADGIQPRTIEVFQSYGLADRLIREGNQMHVAAFYNPTPDGSGIELTDRVPDVTAPTARYPFEVTLHQGAIEAIFLDSMKEMGVEVNRPVRPTSIAISEDKSDHDGHPVRVVLHRLDGTGNEEEDSEVVYAKYVVGADGAHSWVRKSFGIAMEGEQTDYVWGVVDMIPDTDFPDIRNKTALHSNNGSCMIIPREGDKVRLYIQVEGKAAIDAKSGRIEKGRLGPNELLDVARKSFYPYTFKTPQSFDWWTIYIIGQRVASSYSVQDRVFIAGDACHTHSPKAGQGMNASMNDSYNLVWKLAHVLRGWASPDLLKTYEFERRKYAQDLINFDKNFAKLFSGKPRTELNQDGVSHEEFIRAFQTFGGFTSGIGVHYEPSIIANPKHQNLASGLVIGERVPPQHLIRAADGRPFEIQDLLPSDTRFKLLVFTGNTSEPSQLAQLQSLAQELQSPDSFLTKFSPGGKIETLFDIVSISSAKKESVVYNALPPLFRSHWSKAFLDDTNYTGQIGGKTYSTYGIGTSGAMVVVRPDGYVGMVTPLNGVADLSQYFTSFLRVPSN